jgi:hypothetical protein
MPPGAYDAKPVTADDVDSVVYGPCSRDGRNADEPSAFSAAASRSITVAMARFKHGVDGDPEQYVPPRESPATIQRSCKLVESWLRAQRRFQQRALRQRKAAGGSESSSRPSSSSVRSDTSATALASTGGFASMSSTDTRAAASSEPSASRLALHDDVSAAASVSGGGVFVWDVESVDSNDIENSSPAATLPGAVPTADDHGHGP